MKNKDVIQHKLRKKTRHINFSRYLLLLQFFKSGISTKFIADMLTELENNPDIAYGDEYVRQYKKRVKDKFFKNNS